MPRTPPGPQNDLVPFVFENAHLVRVIVDPDESLHFVGADVTGALGLVGRSALAKLADDEKGVHSIDTPGGMQDVVTLTEAGFYTLILRCRQAMEPGTMPFRLRRWVTGEVIPSIRKTGGFGIGSAARVNADQKAAWTAFNATSRLLDTISRTCGKRVAAKAAPAMCARIGIPLDLQQSDTLAQAEMDLGDLANVVPFNGREPA